MNPNNPYTSAAYFEQFDHYLNDDLPADQKATLEQKLANDPLFLEAFEEFKLLLLGIQEHHLKQDLHSFHKEIDSPATFTFKRYAVAASVFILVALGIWVLFFKQDPAQKLYANTFYPDPGLPTTMSTSSNYEFFEGMVSYKRKNYDAAIARWNKQYESNTTNDTLNYFLGVAHLANNNLKNAEHFLTSPAVKQPSVFYEESLYYLALLYLKQNNIEAAQSVLVDAHIEKSKTLLQKINALE